jgi:hypothetical protein
MHVASAAEERVPSGGHPLDELQPLSAEELLELYQSARTPRLEDLEGDLDGRMLASPRVGQALTGPMRSLAQLKLFPWRGKSFRTLKEGKGEGINRVFGDAHPRKWFRFETRLGPSRAGDFDSVQLIYDLPENPFFVRIIEDEVRQLEPGLFLGQAYLRVRGDAHLALYFGLARR